MADLTDDLLPLDVALTDDEWNARRAELEARVEHAARALLNFSRAASILLPFDGGEVLITLTSTRKTDPCPPT